MNLTELLYIAGVLVVLATLRFGVPMAITWAIGKAAGRMTHVPS